MFDQGNWIRFTNPRQVRDYSYDTLLNLSTGSVIEIDTVRDQDKSDQNLYVWVQFPGMKPKYVYYGTPVECIRIVDKLSKQLNAKELLCWGD